MTSILVLYLGVYGHVARMALAEAQGAREVGGSKVVVERVPE